MSEVKQLIHWHLTYTWLMKSVDVEPAGAGSSVQLQECFT
jgi:hypothetical protein